MNRRSTIGAVILICVYLIVSQSYACTDSPIPRIANEYYQDVSLGSRVDFDGVGSDTPSPATGSYDPDNGFPYGGGNGIDEYWWKYGDEPNDPNWHEDGGEPNHFYDMAGMFDVALYVVDDDNSPSDGNDYCEVWVYEVNEVVERWTGDPGPVYLCSTETVELGAVPYPNTGYYPVEETIWEIVEQPADANASLNPSSGSLTTTLSGLDEGGDYVVRAKCGPNDPGDTIVVSTPSSTGIWEDWLPLSECPPEANSLVEDDCGNWLAEYCDSTHHLGSGLAFSWWYTKGQHPSVNRGTEVGMCVWKGGINLAQCKYSPVGKKLWLKTKQMSCNNHKGFYDPHGEGCYWYYCYRYVTFDCLAPVATGTNPSIKWYRDPDLCPCTSGWPNLTKALACPGVQQEHPGHPN